MKVTKANRTTDIYHFDGSSNKTEDSKGKQYGSVAYNQFQQEKPIINVNDDTLVPFHAIEHIETSVEGVEEEQTDPRCPDSEPPAPPTPGDITFEGIPDWLEINAGKTDGLQYDTKTGIKAYEDGNEIPFTASPRYIQVCVDEDGTVTYTAKGVSEEITYHVYASREPTISGVHDIHVGTGDTFEPLAGVSAQSMYGDHLIVHCDAPHIYNEAGTYTITYTATDKCGKTGTATANVYVTADEELKTVLFYDGRFVVNMKVSDIEADGGTVRAEYPHLDEDNPYIFGGANEIPWMSQSGTILEVSFGTAVKPESLAYWFTNAFNLASIDWTNFDGSECVSVRSAFARCSALRTIELPPMPKLKSIRYMCHGCQGIEHADLSNVGTSVMEETTDAFQGCASMLTCDLTGLGGAVLDSQRMFANISGNPNMSIQTIYATNDLDFSGASSSSMFRSCYYLVGAIPFDQNKTDRTYANLQGYFTAKA